MDANGATVLAVVLSAAAGLGMCVIAVWICIVCRRKQQRKEQTLVAQAQTLTKRPSLSRVTRKGERRLSVEGYSPSIYPPSIISNSTYTDATSHAPESYEARNQKTPPVFYSYIPCHFTTQSKSKFPTRLTRTVQYGNVTSDGCANGVSIGEGVGQEFVRDRLIGMLDSHLESPLTRHTPPAFVRLYVCYSAILSILSIKLLGVSPLSSKDAGHHLFAKVRIIQARKKSLTQRTKDVRVDGVSATIEQNINFKEISGEEMENVAVTVSVFVKSNWGEPDRFVGETIIPCSSLPLTSGKSHYVEGPLRPKRLMKKTVVEEESKKHPGSVFVTLQLDAALCRLYVTLHKAENLPGGLRFKTVPNYYASVSLKEGGQVTSALRTSIQPGSTPVWNHSCVFHLTSNDFGLYSLEIAVMRSQNYRKDRLIGQLIIGSSAGKSGASHWLTLMQPRSTGTARWHELTPEK